MNLASNYGKEDSPTKIKDFKYCMLRCNQRVKKAVQIQMKRRVLSLKMLSEQCGVHPYRISEYLKKAYSTYEGTKYPSQKEVVAICAALGIELSITPKIVE